MLLRFLQVYRSDGPEDLAGEVWLQVVRDLASFRGDAADFRRWLFTIARHRAIDAARSRIRRPLSLVGDARVLDDARREPSAEDRVMDRISTEHAIEALRTLPAAQAELVALRVIADLDAATVADLVGSTPGAVRVGVHRALKSLSEHAGLQPVPTPVEVP